MKRNASSNITYTISESTSISSERAAHFPIVIPCWFCFVVLQHARIFPKSHSKVRLKDMQLYRSNTRFPVQISF